jgi:hypothetical protein
MKDLFPLVLITLGYALAILITIYLTPGNDLHEGRDTEERFRSGISNEVRKEADRMWRNFGMRTKPKEKKNENLLDPNREIKDMDWKIRKQRMEDPWANLFGNWNDPWDDKKEADHVDWLKKMFPDFYGADEVAEEKVTEGNQAAPNQESNVNQGSQQQSFGSQEINHSQQQDVENREQNASQNRDSQQTQNSNQYQGYQQQGQNAGNQQQQERAYPQQNQRYQQQGQNQAYQQRQNQANQQGQNQANQQEQNQAYRQNQNQAQQQGQNQRYQQNQQYQQEQQGYQENRNYQGNQQRVPPGYDRQTGENQQPQGNQRYQNQQYDTRKL